MSATRPLRAVVDGPEPLVVDVTPGTAAVDATTGSPAPGRVHSVARLPALTSGAAGVARFEVVVDGWRFEVTLEPLARAELRERAGRVGGARARSGRLFIGAQIPGRVVSVAVAVGDIVEPGQRLLSIEAMKMENAVLAPRAGTIERVGVAAGEAVELGDELVVLA
ncbi:MAG: biotin/lipoyl-containing protein [Candidatus Limnocylindrales bacterium]